MSAWHDVGALSDLERDGRLLVRVGGREIGVLADPLSGALRALRNRCPHHGAPLCLGHVRERTVAAAPGVYALSGRAVVRCPWHGWEYDLETGACVDDPALRAAAYPVRVEAGRVMVQA